MEPHFGNEGDGSTVTEDRQADQGEQGEQLGIKLVMAGSILEAIELRQVVPIYCQMRQVQLTVVTKEEKTL